MIPRIETARLLLRPMRDDDAARLLEFFQDPKTSRFWFTPDKTLDEARARIVRVEKDWTEKGFGDWAVVERDSGRFIGFSGLHHISGMDEVNLGYLLSHEYWGRGYATEACRTVIDFGFDTAKLELIVGVTHPDNGASIRILEKVGMEFWKELERNGTPRVAYSIRRRGNR